MSHMCVPGHKYVQKSTKLPYLTIGEGSQNIWKFLMALAINVFFKNKIVMMGPIYLRALGPPLRY